VAGLPVLSALSPSERIRPEAERAACAEARVEALLPRRVLAWLGPLLGARLATVWVILIGLGFGATSLCLGLTADDHFHALSVRTETPFPGLARAPWDLFAFAKDEATNRALMEAGAFPWWTAPDLVVAFLRPLSSLSLWLDYQLWPESAWMMHLHSLAWYGLLLVAAALLVHTLEPPPRAAALALLVYAVDDARSMPVAWIAHRNALVALAPALLAVALHVRARREGRSDLGGLALFSFALGLGGGEPALPVLGYLAAYALVFERGPWWRRALTLAPYAVLVLVWRISYDALGYGALHSGVYLDPGREPLVFARALATRLPVLLLSALALPMADLWEVYPLVAPWLQPVVLGAGSLLLVLIARALWPLLSGSPELRFWALGSLLSTIPVCGTHPEDRVLSAPSLGCAVLVARFLLHTARAPRRLERAVASLFVLAHLVVAPLLFPVRVLAVDAMEHVMLRADRLLPPASELASQTLVMLNPPVDLLAVYWPVYRASRKLGLPARFRWLATGESDLEVSRVDEHTLRIRPRGGFLGHASQQMFRRVDEPLARGATVELSDVSFEVTDLTLDGRPAEVLVHFALPLTHASLRFVQWGERAYVPFALPADGETVTLPAVSLDDTLFEADPRSDGRP
jgi:hypothetical protein